MPELTGDLRKDIVAVALSQNGYKGGSDGYSYFAAWNGDPYQDWCSEFTAWCAETAKVPLLVFPHLISFDWFRDYYAPLGRCYYLEGAKTAKTSDYLKDFKGIKTISVSELEEGDILITGPKETPREANHTTMFLSVVDGKLRTINGNFDNGVATKNYELSYVHAVIKPDYELKTTKLTKDISEVSWRGTTRAEYTGKTVSPAWELYDRDLHYELKKGRDYTVKLKNALNVGEATAVYTGKGFYTGTLTMNYNIRPAKPILKFSRSSTKIKIKWQEIVGVDKYEIYKYDESSGKYKRVATIDGSRTYTVLSYDPTKESKYKVQALASSKEKQYYYYYTESDVLTVKKKT